MEIKVLGPGCKNCVALEKATREAVETHHLAATVAKVTDAAAIAAYGVMATPALVVDDEVVVSGRVPTARAIGELLVARTG